MIPSQELNLEFDTQGGKAVEPEFVCIWTTKVHSSIFYDPELSASGGLGCSAFSSLLQITLVSFQ